VKEKCFKLVGGKEGLKINTQITLIFTVTAVTGVVVLFIIFNFLTVATANEIKTALYILAPTLFTTFWIQLIYNYRKSKPINNFLYLSEKGMIVSDEEIKEATLSILEFPLKASLVSFSLWLFSGITLVTFLRIILGTSTAKLFYIMVSVISGATAAFIFLYYLFKLPLKNTAFRLLSTLPGKKIQEEYRLISTRTKLNLTIILILFSTISILAMLTYSRSMQITASEEEKIIKELLTPVERAKSESEMLKKFSKVESIIENDGNFDLFLYDVYNNSFLHAEHNFAKNRVLQSIIKHGFNRERTRAPLFAIYHLTSFPQYYAVLKFPEITRTSLGNVIWMIILLTTISILLAIILLQFFSSDISRPIMRTKEFVKQMKKGDLTGKIFIVSEDEMFFIAHLLRSYRDATIRILNILNHYESELIQVTTSLTESIESFKEKSEKMETEEIIQEFSEVDIKISELTRSASSLRSFSDRTAGIVKELKMRLADLGKFNDQTVTMLSSLEFEKNSLKEIADRTGNAIKNLMGALDAIEKKITNLVNHINSQKFLLEKIGKENESIHDKHLSFKEIIKELSLSVTTLEPVFSSLVRDMEVFRENLAMAKELAIKIGSLSENSELISFNAAIIAASSENYSRDFSIIAEEMRELTQRTLSITEGIKEKVDWISFVETEIFSKIDLSVRQFKDIKATLNSMKDNSEIAHVLSNNLREELKSISHDIVNLEETLQEIESGFWKGKKGLEGLDAAFHNLLSELTNLEDAINKLFNISGGLKESIITSLASYETLEKNYRKNLPLFEEINKNLNYLNLGMKRKNEAISSLKNNLASLKSVVNEIKTSKEKLLSNLSTLTEINKMFKW